MALAPKKIDPVQGLVDYILEIKPYHTKIIETLVEYIHTDNIIATITDSIEFCINLGAPNLNSIFAFTINDIDLSQNRLVINTDVSNFVNIGQRVEIAFSIANNGFYYVTDVIFDNIAQKSFIHLRETLPSDIAGGTVTTSTIEYCPDSNVRTTHVLPLPEVFCEGGWGNIWDSYSFLVLAIDDGANTITIGGDQTSVLEETTTVSLVDPTLFVTNDPLLPGFKDEILSTFHIAGTTFVGGNTVVQVIESIAAINPPPGIYELFAYNIGWDDPLECFTDDPGTKETVFVSFTEDFKLDITQNLTDDIHTSNWENTAQNAWDTVDFGVLDSPTAPVIPESAIPPALPSLFDFWYDTGTQSLRQWQNYGWNKIKVAYWYQPDPIDLQNSKYYRLIKNAFDDSGWVEIHPCRPSTEILLDEYDTSSQKQVATDPLSCSWDGGPWSQEPYTIFHEPSQVLQDPAINGIFLLGGDFRHQIIGETTMQGFDGVGLTAEHKSRDYNVEKMDAGTNSLTLHSSAGDLTTIFKLGVGFNFLSILTKSRQFTVASSSYNGTNTIIIVNEIINDYDNNLLLDQDPLGIGNIPAVFYIQPNVFSVPTQITQVSTLVIPSNPINVNTESISYYWRGPYRLELEMMHGDNISSTIIEAGFTNEIIITADQVGTTGDISATAITDELVFGWGDITQWFQYVITFIDTGTSLILVAGNATSDIQIAQEIRIIGLVDNAGIYTVNSVFFNGINTEIIVDEIIPTNTVGGAFVEPTTDLPMELFFIDTIGVGIEEVADAEVLTTAGALLPGALDFPQYDVGSFDENISTVIHLYGN